MPKLTIVTEGGRYEFENDSVQNVGDLLRETSAILNIPSTASVAVNGAPATAATTIADGDEVSTTKPAGRKGPQIKD
jgi:hypothetical protein